MQKDRLEAIIRTAFKEVQLEDGVGLWQAQGLDDYADEKTMQELIRKDEREDWSIIPTEQLIHCASSLSFFDAKGMRFHLPAFMLLDISLENPLDAVTFTLGYDLEGDYQNERFSLLNSEQIRCITYFLEDKLELIKRTYRELYGPEADAFHLNDLTYNHTQEALLHWQHKIVK